MNAIVIGSVQSSQVVLESLLRSSIEVAMVFSLDESVSADVSGYHPIHEIAEKNKVPYRKYIKINDEENVRLIEEISPDYIFAVGFSQLIGERIIKAAKHGVVGYHPTPLPKFRGRAAMVWQVLLGVRESACTMFFIDEGMDSGDIIAQEPYIIEDSDYAQDLEEKLYVCAKALAEKVIKKLETLPVEVTKQNEDEATYLLRRTPEDGLIDWREPIEKIHRLIRAVSHPYPGAFSNYDGKHRIIIWRAEMLPNRKYIGINGQIAKIDDSGIYVVCMDGLLQITEYENVDGVKLFVGHKLKD